MTQALDIALLKQQVQTLETKVKQDAERIAQLEKIDQSRLRAAVITLGTVVLGLGGYIWSFMVEGKN